MSSPTATKMATISSPSASVTEDTRAARRSAAPTAQQGFLARLKPGPRLLKHLLRCWPTYWWAGIKVREISADWTRASVELKLGLLNRNFFGTAFGGSLYAMTDPFYALLMFSQLGEGYVVWDKAAQVQFIKPGRGRMTAEFVLPTAEVARVRALADASHDAKVEPEYCVEVRDQRGELIALVHKTLYVRRLRDGAGN